jgi:uncharacterized protein YkwD
MATKKRKVHFHHFVLPHKHKKHHRKAHLLSHTALLIYVAAFIILQLGFNSLRAFQPGVLGTTSAITKEEVIRLTNVERENNGLPLLKENSLLDKAAEDKAKNMFTENYWAHNSPSGLTPWVWFKQEGYEYIYAGENLARGYSTSTDTVNAWMASKMGHKENLLSDKYQEIGIAVEDGIINGEKTTLVVQHFGTSMAASGDNPTISEDASTTVTDNNLATTKPSTQTLPLKQTVQSAATKPLTQQSSLSNYLTINQYSVNRFVVLGAIFLLVTLGLIDIGLMHQKKAIHPLHIRHFPHVGLITLGVIMLLILKAGSIV